MAHMLGSKFTDQEVAWEGALADVSVCVCVRLCVCVAVRICVWKASQCVRDQEIRLKGDKAGFRILAVCH